MWNVLDGPTVLSVSNVGIKPVAMSLLKRERWKIAYAVSGAYQGTFESQLNGCQEEARKGVAK